LRAIVAMRLVNLASSQGPRLPAIEPPAKTFYSVVDRLSQAVVTEQRHARFAETACGKGRQFYAFSELDRAVDGTAMQPSLREPLSGASRLTLSMVDRVGRRASRAFICETCGLEYPVAHPALQLQQARMAPSALARVWQCVRARHGSGGA